jgi:hypothetical protein
MNQATASNDTAASTSNKDFGLINHVLSAGGAVLYCPSLLRIGADFALTIFVRTDVVAVAPVT